MLMLIICAPAWSQYYHFEQYGVRDGLPHAEVYDIIQADDYTLWIATEGGVAQFNGYAFDTYSTHDGLRSNDVTRLFEDEEGGIWVGHNAKGVNYISQDSVHDLPGLNGLIGSTHIGDIDQGCSGAMYFFTPKGIYRYQDEKVDVLLDSLPAQANGPTLATSGMALKDCEHVIAGNHYGDVYLLSLEDGQIEFLQHPSLQDARLPIYSFVQDEDENVWIGGQRLFKYNGSTTTLINIPPRRHQDMCFNHEGTLLSALEGGGLGRYNPRLDLYNQVDRHKGFPAIYNYAICEDHERNVWIGSYGKGLVMSRDLSSVYYDQTNGLRSTLVGDFQEWQGALYIATNGGTFKLIDGQIVDTLFTYSSCRSLDILPNGNLLAGTHRGIREVDVNGSVTRHNNIDVYSSQVIDGQLWYTDEHGLHQVGNDTILQLHRNEMEGWGPYVVIRHFSTITFLKGIHEIEWPELGLDTYGGFRSMDIINENELLLLSEKHIHHLTRRGDEITIQHIDISFDLEFDMANSLLVDDDLLWISSRNHIYQVSLPRLLQDQVIEKVERSDFSNKLAEFVVDDGLWMDSHGQLWCKTLNRLWVFDPAQSTHSIVVPQPSVRSVKVNQKPVDWPTNSTKPLHLDYQDRHLSISMQSGSYTNPTGVKYKYRLSGMDGLEDWSQPTSEHEVVFSYLPDGNYRFEFLASNGHEVWSVEPVGFSFSIARPYWRRTDFWVAVVGLIVILALAALTYYSRLKAQHKQEILRRTYGAHEEERLRLSREIHDSIGQQLSFMHRRLKKQGFEEMADVTQMVLAESRALSMGLHPPSLSRFGLHAAISDLLDQLQSQHLITVSREIEDLHRILSAEEETQLYRIAQEGLNNIIKHAHADAVIFCLVKKNDAVLMHIEDDGVGFSFAPDASPTGGLGFASIAERCLMIGAQLDIDSVPQGGTTLSISKAYTKT